MKHSYLTLIVFLSLQIICNGQNTSTPKSKKRPAPTLSGNPKSEYPSTGIISGWIASAKNNVEVLPKDVVNGSSVNANGAWLPLNHTQTVTPEVDSALNEMASGYGGILINHGWIRILGAGCKRLNRSLPEWNKGKSFTNSGDNPSFVLIADDAVGGFFAVNTGGIDNHDINRVFYYGPNGLQWQSTGLDYRSFMKFCFSGNIADFYSDFFWKGWQQDVKKLSGDQVVSCYPLLWTREGKELKCNRKTVSVQKVWELYHHNDVAEVKKRNSTKHTPSPSLVYQKH